MTTDEAMRALTAILPQGSSICIAPQGQLLGIEYTSPKGRYFAADNLAVEDAADTLPQWISIADLEEHPEYSNRRDFEGAELARGSY